MSPRGSMAREGMEIPNDIGIMPATFIRPTGTNKPSLFKTPGERFSLEYNWARTKMQDLFSRVYYKYWLRKGKPRPRLDSRQLAPLAKDLHQQMYKAFAAGDTATLSTICCSGLLATLSARLSHRSPSTSVSWTLLSHLQKPRLVSNRATVLPFPGLKASGMRQAVVKIRSRQALVTLTAAQARKALASKLASLRARQEAGETDTSLAKQIQELETLQREGTKRGGAGAAPVVGRMARVVMDEEGGERVEKEVTEYMVLQRRMLDGVEEDWMVWGFVEETTPERWRDEERKVKEAMVYQQSQAQGA